MDKFVYTNMNYFVAAPLFPNVYVNSTTEDNEVTFILNPPSANTVIAAAIQLCVPTHQHKN